MVGLVHFVIFVAIVVLVASILYWALAKLLGQLPGLPPVIIVVLQVVIVLVALLVIIERGWPLIGAYS